MGEWHRDPDVSAFVFEEGSEVVAYGEIWKESQEIELARLIVRPDHRGKGYGRALLLNLIEIAKKFERDIWLRVIPSNKRAKDIYLKNGFQIVDSHLQNQFNHGQAPSFIWMKLIE